MKDSKALMMVLLMAATMAVPTAILAEELAAEEDAEDPLVTLEVTKAEAKVILKKLAVLKHDRNSKWDTYYNETRFSTREVSRVLNKSIADENAVDAETRDQDFIKQCRELMAQVSKRWDEVSSKTIDQVRADRRDQSTAVNSLEQGFASMLQVERYLGPAGIDIGGLIAMHKSIVARGKELVDELTEGVATVKGVRDEFSKCAEDAKKLDGEHFGR